MPAWTPHVCLSACVCVAAARDTLAHAKRRLACSRGQTAPGLQQGPSRARHAACAQHASCSWHAACAKRHAACARHASCSWHVACGMWHAHGMPHVPGIWHAPNRMLMWHAHGMPHAPGIRHVPNRMRSAPIRMLPSAVTVPYPESGSASSPPGTAAALAPLAGTLRRPPPHTHKHILQPRTCAVHPMTRFAVVFALSSIGGSRLAAANSAAAFALGSSINAKRAVSAAMPSGTAGLSALTCSVHVGARVGAFVRA
eukprot:363424-Chlamydomonas_euryale.AAC.3